jgi:hypothetical protein
MTTFVICADGESIKCLRCGFVSHHPLDVAHLYCGHCNQWHYPYQDASGMRWRLAGSRPTSELADQVMRECGLIGATWSEPK